MLVFKTNHHTPTFYLVPTILEMEQLHLLNKLEQLCHVDRRPFNQLVFTPNVEHVELITTPTFIRQGVIYQQGVIYPQGTWPTISILGISE
jgi:hypothetical protein